VKTPSSPLSHDSAATERSRSADVAAEWARLALFAIFAIWVWRHMREPDGLLHGSLLVFHEAGHVFFMPLGEFMMVLGGSLFQLLVPAFLVGYFAVRRDAFGACFAALYLAASCADVAVYIADARAGDLPLIGGAHRSNHDWTFLLIEMKRLEQDTVIGHAVHGAGRLIYLGALFSGGWVWFFGARSPFAQPAPTPLARTEQGQPEAPPSR
jgi:hypothetical protein